MNKNIEQVWASKIVKCKTCENMIGEFEGFPGGVCVECWAKTPEGQYIPTAQELAAMFGGRSIRF
jgi:hypothetical protein